MNNHLLLYYYIQCFKICLSMVEAQKSPKQRQFGRLVLSRLLYTGTLTYLGFVPLYINYIFFYNAIMREFFNDSGTSSVSQLQQPVRAKVCFARKTHTAGNDGQRSTEQLFQNAHTSSGILTQPGIPLDVWSLHSRSHITLGYTP